MVDQIIFSCLNGQFECQKIPKLYITSKLIPNCTFWLMIESLFLSLLFLAHFFHIYYYVFGCCKTANWTMTLKLKHVSFFNCARTRREFKIIFDTPFMMMLWNSTFDTGSIDMMRDEASDSNMYSRFIVASQWHWFLLPSIYVWIKQQLTSRLKCTSYTAPCVNAINGLKLYKFLFLENPFDSWLKKKWFVFIHKFQKYRV